MIDTAALPWPKGPMKAKVLLLDGTEQVAPVRQDGSKLVVTVLADEISALRFDR